MTLSPILSAPDATTIALDFGVFIAKRAKRYRTSPAAIIAALRPVITPEMVTTRIPNVSGAESAETADLVTTPDPTPSQPVPPPAVQTDAEVQSSLASAPVDLIPEPAAPAATPAKPTGPQAKHAAEASPDAGGVQDRCASTPPTPLQPSERLQVLATHQANPDWSQRRVAEHVGCARSTAAKWIAAATKPAIDPANPPAKRITRRAMFLALHAEHPEWCSKDYAAHMGISTVNVLAIASQTKTDIPRAKRVNLTEATTAALREAVRPQRQSLPPPTRELPPAATPQVSRPLRDIPRRSPVGPGTATRFYLRDKTTGQWAHQSLSPCPSGTGPKMTSVRSEAWFDNLQRYRGAKAKWPELAFLRKEAAQ